MISRLKLCNCICPYPYSTFYVSGLITLAPKVSAATFATIKTPRPDLDLDDLRNILYLIERYIPGIKDIPLKQGMSFVPTWKSFLYFDLRCRGILHKIPGE